VKNLLFFAEERHKAVDPRAVIEKEGMHAQSNAHLSLTHTLWKDMTPVRVCGARGTRSEVNFARFAVDLLKTRGGRVAERNRRRIPVSAMCAGVLLQCRDVWRGGGTCNACGAQVGGLAVGAVNVLLDRAKREGTQIGVGIRTEVRQRSESNRRVCGGERERGRWA
jgi:hypothetical protein